MYSQANVRAGKGAAAPTRPLPSLIVVSDRVMREADGPTGRRALTAHFGWKGDRPGVRLGSRTSEPVGARYDHLRSFVTNRSLSSSTNTSWSLGPTILSRIMPTYLQLLFEMMIFRNSIQNGSCTFSVLTAILAQGSSNRALTYTTQVRSGGSQVFVGYGNHRAEPVAVLRRAPTLTDEQGQQRVGSRALSPSEL